MADYDIWAAFYRIETILIESMVRNLGRHRAEETKDGLNWAQWQAIQLKELDRYRKNNKKRFAGGFKDIKDRVIELLKNEYSADDTKPERRFLESFIGRRGESSKASANTKIEGSFFGVNERRLNALIDATTEDLEKAERAVLRKADDEYRKVIFDAQAYMASGAATYEQAVDMATKDFRERGLDCIVYKNGARHTIEDYASMALKTAQKRAYLLGQGKQLDAYGIHTVQVNVRTDACPLCAVWLGRVLVDDVYAHGTKEEAAKAGVPLVSQAMDAGFLHPNCKDVYSIYIEGVSKPEKPLTKAEIQQIVFQYNTAQKSHQAKRKAEQYARMARTALDPASKQKYDALAAKWTKRAEEYDARLKSGLVPPSGPEPEIEIEDPTLTYHDGLREAIDVTYSGDKLVGLQDVTDFVQVDDWKADSDHKYVQITKRITLDWNNLSKYTQRRISWYAPNLIGKGFYLQKADSFVAWDRDFSTSRIRGIEALADQGYTYIGDRYMQKYGEPWGVAVLEKDGRTYLAFAEIEKESRISDDTMQALVGREKQVSDVLWQSKTRFSDLTARQGDDWIKAMEKFHTAVEADRGIALVSQEVYDAVKGEELYRGIAPSSHLRGDLSAMTKTPEECAAQLMEGGIGNCFPSRGVYGDCIAYLSNSTKVGFQYATDFYRTSGGVVVRMKIKDDARKITYEDARKLFNEINAAHPRDNMPYFSKNQRRLTNDVEVGKAMQMLGYDYIYEPHGDGMSVHFYMILNRNCLISVKDDYVKARITDEVLRRGRI